MNISVIGTGYVGLTTGACLSELGMKVICMDTDEEKIEKLKKGIIPIYEPNLGEIVQRNYMQGNLKFTTELKETVENSQVIFIAVGTPALDNYETDTSYLFNAVNGIGKYLNAYKTIVVKSTVPIGTCRKIKERIIEIQKQNNKTIDFEVISNPEFLRQGTAVSDFFKPDRIVIGSGNTEAIEVIKEVYIDQIRKGIPVVISNIETAEMIKYASNAFLATKISFINEIANMCELCNADAITVSKAMGLDTRIGSKFLDPGPGFGGSCFPKDSKALISIGKSIGYTPKIIESAIEVNDNQYNIAINKARFYLKDLNNKTISILGISFKPDTDDVREAPAIRIINTLLQNNSRIKVYDPKAMKNASKVISDANIDYCDSPYSACEESDCIILVTEWEEFKKLDFNILKRVVNNPLLIDLRNVFNPDSVRIEGFMYEGVGRK